MLKYRGKTLFASMATTSYVKDLPQSALRFFSLGHPVGPQTLVEALPRGGNNLSDSLPLYLQNV